MTTYPAGFRVAQAVGLTGAAWLSGNIATYSLSPVPSLLTSAPEAHLSPSAVAKIWRSFYDRGKTQNPPIAVVTAASFFYLGWSVRTGAPLFRKAAENASTLYYIAGLLTVGMVPYTLAVMMGTNNKLAEKAKAVEAEPAKAMGKGDEVEVLANRWIYLNGVRSLFPLAGALVGFCAACM
ncbi:hypothetical protein FQN55_008554 [Onygenales sp. PD_40]|nr:hypothetical protein FQN55_008554 [Onygenales sp. PD_40]KAK2785543.1 hypothetical protein FQN53_007628 [Emmonsiellopsis sp. PD_33]KAK2785596.1 hypothetical protein FQN52_008375 [Onygenales sp. PD_12]KAK2806244.1 hypothetical protein FQN51_007285 [Onygenales sp. PD_10]